MSERVDFFFSFRSPYSYLAAPRAFALADLYDIDVVFRGVIPMVMRGQSVPRAKSLHTLRDVAREADRLGMPFGRIHDPVGAGALRCLVAGEHAVDVGLERAFVETASRAIWGEAVDVAGDRGHWGVPVFTFRGEQFWGQDRIEDLEVTLGAATTMESTR